MHNHTHTQTHTCIYNAKSHSMNTSADQCFKPPDPPPKHMSTLHIIYKHSHLKPLKSGETTAKRTHSATQSVSADPSPCPSNIDKAITISPVHRGYIFLLLLSSKHGCVEDCTSFCNTCCQVQRYLRLLIGFICFLPC